MPTSSMKPAALQSLNGSLRVGEFQVGAYYSPGAVWHPHRSPVRVGRQQGLRGLVEVRSHSGVHRSWHLSVGERPNLRQLLSTIILSAFLVQISPGEAGADSRALPVFVFVNENPNGPNSVESYRVDPAGAPTLVGSYPTGGTGSDASFLASERAALALPYDLAQTSGHLYALNLGDNTVSVFSIDPYTGALALQYSPVAVGATAIAVNPAGTVLYTGSASNEGQSDLLAAWAINPDGSLATSPTSVVNAAVDGLTVSPDGSEVAAAYPDSSATNPSQPSVELFSTGAGGTHLTETSSLAVACPTDVRFSQEGSTLYSAACNSGALTAYQLSGGVIQPGSQLSVIAGQTLAVGPNGHIYFQSPSGLEAAIPTGSGYTLGPATTYPSSEYVSSMAVSPDGTQLFVASLSSGTVGDYAIGSGGALTLVGQLAVPAGLPTLGVVQGSCPGTPDPSGSTCADEQSMTVTIDPGSLTVTTPYTSSNPFVMPDVSLSPDASMLAATARFPAAGDPQITVQSSLAGNPNWSLNVSDTDLTCVSGSCTSPRVGQYQMINGENVGLTEGSSTLPLPCATFPGTITFTDIQAGAALSPSDSGTAGLKGGPHTFAQTNTGGNGTVSISGQLTITAPTATQAGTYSGTIALTVG